MKLPFRSERARPPEQSIVLVDWSVRESHHALDFLARQDVPRDAYEVIWIEYYDAEPEAIRARLERARLAGEPPPVDQWIVLGMPRDAYYHKHLLYDVGLVAARGRIVTFCDSDAMFSPSFVRAHLDAFARDDRLVLYLDEVRSADRRFYPFSGPSFAEVMASECINLVDGRPAGIPGPDGLPVEEPLHVPNYGACMTAPRDALIGIGGADEHDDFLGHVCGPYDLGFRLIHAGLRERWHDREWLVHTWHPGAHGEKNYVGPHDGRHLAMASLRARESGRTRPRVESPAVRALRERAVRPDLPADLLAFAAAPAMAPVWSSERLMLYTSDGRSPAELIRAHPALAARAALRAARAALDYAALVARTSGLARTPALGEDRGNALVQRARSLSGKLRKTIERRGLPAEILRDCVHAVRQQVARVRQRLEGLASEGVREVGLYGEGLLAAAARTLAPAYGLRIVAAQDAASDAPVLLARRFEPTRERRRLAATGIEVERIVVIDDDWVEAERPLSARVERSRAIAPAPALSLVMPTRGRPALARATLDAIVATAADPDSIEVVIYADEDDPGSHGLGHERLQVVRLVGARGTMGAITERCVVEARGELLMLFNDDVALRTPGWDRRLREAFERFPDRIALVWGDDLHQRHRSPTFPVISRATLDALGWAASAELRHFHIESHLHDVFRRLARLGHERRVFLPEVVFEHHFEAGGARDATGSPRARTARRDRTTYGLLAEERAPAALRLRDAIMRRDAARGASPPDGTCTTPRLQEPFAIESIGVRPHAPRLSLLLVSNETMLPPYGAGAHGPSPRALAETGLDPGIATEIWLVRWRSGALGAALAAALARAGGDVILVLPLDAEAAPGFARAAVERVTSGATAALVPALVERRNGRLRRRFARLERAGEGLVVREPGRGDPFDAAAERARCADDAAEIAGGLHGLFVRRAALAAIGGIDETLQSELVLGLDVCARLAANGHAIVAGVSTTIALPPEDVPCDAAELQRIAAKALVRAG